MAVAVQGPRGPSALEIANAQGVDPMDKILKGLQAASAFYGITEAADLKKKLVEEKAAKAKQEEFENQTKLVGGGMKIDPSGKVVPDLENPFLQKKLAEKDTSLSDAVKLMTLESMKSRQGELNIAQSKQSGLYKSGLLANQQYLDATSDPDKYDPTSIKSGIRNLGPYVAKSDLSKKAESAQSAWVESFLRDASGASIPTGERLNYAKDFFPRPGDTPEIVANKEALRAQKMETAKMAVGPKLKNIENVSVKSFPRQVRKGGQTATVSNDSELKEAIAEGWK